MSTYEIVPIAPEKLDAMRAKGEDEFGNPWKPYPAGGWEPLRCCLNESVPGEAVALICYTPWTEPSPWMEAGPVFVHAERCAGYLTRDRYPENMGRGKCMFNTFDADGNRAYEHITFVSPGDAYEDTLAELLGRPEVAFVHVRSVEAGCLAFEAHPAR
ncbi:Protein of unknown function [Actinopolymorpha cephalotaxi]|uniref:DUF1203 domain-containing protein n=1 Tax=Actinopolymorpha cephalotaxi TaxID=504797 RepID=A0A1I2NMF0_9ACTN|nr:DUF1203 domain-containing protein [Actinopolymorpha cephalotaxi]NYH85450.1 hypothetical protein [Actinopolymorpha cephalotaxi]SFG04808.1 Protein of unknown function [Actinopolymorpha cephalotaxi]